MFQLTKRASLDGESEKVTLRFPNALGRVPDTLETYRCLACCCRLASFLLFSSAARWRAAILARQLPTAGLGVSWGDSLLARCASQRVTARHSAFPVTL
jgi:hypothetical protein